MVEYLLERHQNLKKKKKNSYQSSEKLESSSKTETKYTSHIDIESMLNIVISFHEGMKASIISDVELLGSFDVTNSLKQGIKF